jgi:ribosomal protein S18 acetylase RimI-like enzyme
MAAGQPDFRTQLSPGDPAAIEQLVRDTGFFSTEEIAIARELADDGLANGPASHYRFVIAERAGALLGYTCSGPIPGTQSGWDLYWIAVRHDAQGQHLGRDLLEITERAVQAAGGTRLYAETSSRAQYEPTRAFYRRRGYTVAAQLPEFYGPGDDKLVYSKLIG